MFAKLTVICAALLMAFAGTAEARVRGVAAATTTVADWSSNTCQIGEEQLKGAFFGAVAEAHWDAAAACGKCITVRGIQGRAFTKKYLVKIVDYCIDCDSVDIELSHDALTAIEGGSAQKKRIEWEWAPCTSVEGQLNNGTGRGDLLGGRKLLERRQQ